MPSLIELIRASGIDATYDETSAATVTITNVTADSRAAGPGVAFVAIPGTKANGAQFIDDAIARGAPAVFASSDVRHPPSVIRVANPRLALAKLALALYPQQPPHMVAVTGTDGKTSTADFFRQLAAFAGHKAASIGTLGALGTNREELSPGIATTPDPVSLHRLLSELAGKGYTHAALEASSHGLDQYRLDGVRLQAAAFTNLTRDHLDYHGTEEAYFAAKARLFTELLPQGATAVLNADDARSAALTQVCRLRGIRVLTFGKSGADLRVEKQTPTPLGQEVTLSLFGTPYAISLPHYGAFQVHNMLAALGLLAACGEDIAPLIARLPELDGVPGRLERVAVHPSGAPLFIDYAHTPAALANVLKTLRAHTQKRLVVVFGCGGDRDRGKRPEMGRAAAELTDIAIVTDDNPRSEDPAAIRAEVLAGAPGCKEVADRRKAIYAAVQLLEAGDVLLVAGKGHEKTQTIGAVAHPFDDAEVLKDALKP